MSYGRTIGPPACGCRWASWRDSYICLMHLHSGYMLNGKYLRGSHE